jgi:SAM-dependent MidA family methyltransferase
VIANELLDNLAFDLVERSATGWLEIRVGVTEAGTFYEVPVPASEEMVTWLGEIEVPAGARLPVQHAAGAWIDDCAARLHRGVVLVLDYAAELDELVRRGAASDGSGWLRTYRDHRRGGPPLEDPGAQDITTDVVLPTLRREASRAGFTVAIETTQAAWLRALGIDALVDEGRRAWEAGAARGDLAALMGRSRVTEAAALTDLDGLGAHTVIVLTTRR